VWTVESLYTHFSRIIKDLDKQTGSRFKASNQISIARKEAINIAIKSVESTASAAQQASEEAVKKAEAASEKRFDSVNEFRKTLTDQATFFATKEEMENRFKTNADKIAELVAWRGRIEGREMGKGEATTSRQVGREFIVTLIMALIAVAAVVVAVLKK
jgi:hypothetical protein